MFGHSVRKNDKSNLSLTATNAAMADEEMAATT